MTAPDPDINRPADPQPTTDERIAQAISVGDLCARLCTAFGVDPETNQGFQLTVRGGSIPELIVYALPPSDGREFTDEWAAGAEGVAARGLAFAVLPGQLADAPPARDPGPDDGNLPELRLEAMVARILPMMADVINGAYVPPATRDWLTSMAHLCRDHANDRMMNAIRSRLYEAAGVGVAFAADGRHPFDSRRSDDGTETEFCWCGYAAHHYVHDVTDGTVQG